MIDRLSLEEFVAILHKNVSPTSPVQSEEHLFGRRQQLKEVEQALYSPGRSIFIYGDRGVGKTSLAQTIAYSHQTAAHDPILLACEPNTTFEDLMTSVLERLRGPRSKRSAITQKINAGVPGLALGIERTSCEEIVPQIQAVGDLNGIVTALLEISSSRQNESIVVVVDEFDRIDSDLERARFADFIKQVGDQCVPIHFVFCGVAASLEKLLGAHESCYRYLDGVKLATLTYDARFEIVDNVSKALGVRVDDRPRTRIAMISDGFPHFIHRMCEQLFWQMFDDPLPCKIPTADHYRRAVVGSVKKIEQHLKHTYDRAVLKDAPGYERVLWAVADHSDMIRNTESIYESYRNIMNDFSDGLKMLDRHAVVARLNALKGASCGNILKSERKGWYRFDESMMRGYVRLKAEEQGCELRLDFAAASTRDRELSWSLPSVRRRKFGTTQRDLGKLDFPN